MSKRVLIVPAALAAGLLSSTAIAEPPPASGDSLCFTLGRDVAELRQEVRAMRGMIEELLRAQRAGAGAGGGGGGSPQPGDAPLSSAPVSPPDAPVPPGGVEHSAPKTGVVTGKLTLPAGDTVGWVFEGAISEPPVTGQTAEVVQVDKRFSPGFLVVQKGTRVVFPNKDPVYHNVFSISPGNKFDLGMLRSGDATASRVFDKPGLVEVYCNMHSSMNVTVLVVPNKHRVQVGADGRYTLSGVPVGKRKLVAWSPSGELVEQWVTLQPGNNTADFALKKRRVTTHLRKDETPYPQYE